jgi:AraC family transcriptional regulator, transcriptional activator of pobA
VKKIPILNPQHFVRDYFDHTQMEEDGFNINKITPKEQHCFFVISAVEEAVKYINFPIENIKTNYYEFIFLTNGYSISTDNLRELTQNKNQIRFVAPGKITSFKELSSDSKGFYCLFDKAYIETYGGVSNLLNSFAFYDLDAIPIINLTESQTQFFDQILKKVLADFSENFFTLKASICSYIIAILKECSLLYAKEIQNNNKLTSGDRISQEFIRLVNKYYLSKRTLSEYADLLSITTKHLTKCVKQYSGETPMDFIQKMLVLEAKVLLKETTQSVAEIAYQLSFEDAAYFNRFFKQHTGVTPANFRNKK